MSPSLILRLSKLKVMRSHWMIF